MTRKFVPCINNPETEEIYSALKTFCCLWLKKFPVVSTCFSGIVKFEKDFIINVCMSMQKFKSFNQVSPQGRRRSRPRSI